MNRTAALILAAALGSLACAPSAPPSADLTGAWRGAVQFSGGLLAPMKDLGFLYSFNAGGTMTESSNYDEAQPVTPAYGVWRRSGARTFEAKYVFYNTKPPAKFDDLAKGGGWMPLGRGDLFETITLSEDGQSYESNITLDLYDQAGKPMAGGGRATAKVKRIGF